MARVVRRVREPLITTEGTVYKVRICGRERSDGMWEGWIEFDPGPGFVVLRTPRATTQPKLTDLEYWAGGISEVYLAGALDKAVRADEALETVLEVPEPTTYEGPAPHPSSVAGGIQTPGPGDAVLDPISVYYAKGEDVLRRHLAALNRRHLVETTVAYALFSPLEVDITALDDAELIGLMVVGLRARLAA
jgi:hypothetical protein